MFGFLKDKLKKTLSIFSRKVEEEVAPEKVEPQIPPTEEKPLVEPKAPPKLVGKKDQVARREIIPEKIKENRPQLSKKSIAKGPSERAVHEEPRKVHEEKPPIKIQEEKHPFVPPKIEKQRPVMKIEPVFKDVEQIIPVEQAPISKTLDQPAVVEEPAEVPAKKGFFQRISQSFTTQKLSDEKFDELFFDLEVALLESNVAMEVVEKIKKDLKEHLVDRQLRRGQLEKVVEDSLKESVKGLFDIEGIDLLRSAKKHKPLVICFIGVNGSGKTTTIAKLARYLMDHGLSVVIAAGDTFRAASHEQLEIHAERLGVKLIRHDYGADPAAVAFDAIEHAKAKNRDVVLIDTAGRQHSNQNLMDELKKVVRVAKPDLKIFVGDSLTGNDCVEQAREFNDAVGIDAIVLSKVDVDEKGGAAISVSFVTKKPIIFIGTGQDYKDLEPFESEKVIASLGLG